MSAESEATLEVFGWGSGMVWNPSGCGNGIDLSCRMYVRSLERGKG